MAKLAAHADDLYAEVLKAMQKETVRSLWDKDWLPIISGKQALYNGVAQFNQVYRSMLTLKPVKTYF